MVLMQYVVSPSYIVSGSEDSDESSSQETTTIPTPSPAAEVTTTEDSHSTHSVCGVSGMYLVWGRCGLELSEHQNRVDDSTISELKQILMLCQWEYTSVEGCWDQNSRGPQAVRNVMYYFLSIVPKVWKIGCALIIHRIEQLQLASWYAIQQHHWLISFL